MARPRSTHPTDGELELLNVLWDRGPSTLGEIRERLLEQREVATTTVATMLKVMREKKLAERRDSDRGYLWSARVRRDATAGRLLQKLLDGVFDGSPSQLVSHLLQPGKLDDDERRRIDDLLGRHGIGGRRKKS